MWWGSLCVYVVGFGVWVLVWVCVRGCVLEGSAVVTCPGGGEREGVVCKVPLMTGLSQAVVALPAFTLSVVSPVLCLPTCMGFVQVRRLTFSEARKLPILEFRLADILTAMELTMPQFVDLCILCGCDYTDTIRGIGPKNALKLIKTHGTIEKVLESLDTTKFPLPESFDYAQVRVSPSCVVSPPPPPPPPPALYAFVPDAVLAWVPDAVGRVVPAARRLGGASRGVEWLLLCAVIPWALAGPRAVSAPRGHRP
jgi:hypothetical protein